jgi:transposase
MSAMPKMIDSELKARAVRLVNEHLGVGKESVRRWVLESQIDDTQRRGARSEEPGANKTLKPKVRRTGIPKGEILRLNSEHKPLES